MNSENTIHEISFLVAADKWDTVVRIFKEDLGVTKEKQDASDRKMADHYVVKVNFKPEELVDDFYEKVYASPTITIISDAASTERAKRILELTAPIEIKLRGLIIYAHELVDTYFEIVRPKNIVAKTAIQARKLVDKNMHDAAVAFLDIGEMITILDSAGNKVDTESLSDDVVSLLDQAQDFESFKKEFTSRFKRLTVWDVIANAVLQRPITWHVVKKQLEIVRNARNQAAHSRVITPTQLAEIEKEASDLLPKLSKKQSPAKYDIDKMAKTFEEWSRMMQTTFVANKAFLDAIGNINNNLNGTLNSFKIVNDLGKNLASNLAIGKLPNINSTTYGSLLHDGLYTDINNHWVIKNGVDTKNDSDREDNKGDDEDGAATLVKKK